MASSILTNASAMSALQSLTATQKALNMTQSQVSTGLRVASASDNAAYWAISTTMKSDTGVLSAVSDALNLGSSTVGVATAGINATLTIMNKMKADLATAQTPGTDLASINTDIQALQSSLKSISTSASFNGVNMLSYDSTVTGSGTVTIVSSYSRSSTGTGSIGTLSISTSKTILFDTQTGTASTNVGILTGTSGSSYTGASLSSFTLTSSLTATDLSNLSKDIDSAISKITTAGEVLGATQTNINNQSTFVSALSDAITSGVGSLVDADMNVASTRLQALQTQQQLGIQSLSIANQNSQLILKLFG